MCRNDQATGDGRGFTRCLEGRVWGSLHITMSLHAYSQNTNVETEATKTQKTHTITIKHADSILNRCNIFASNAFNELLEVTETGRQKNLQYFINKLFFTRPRSEHSPTFVNNSNMCQRVQLVSTDPTFVNKSNLCNGCRYARSSLKTSLIN